MDLLHIDIFDQYLVDSLLSLIMHFFFPDPQSPVINVLYRWSGIYGQFWLCSVLFFFSNIIKLNHFIFRHSSSSFLHIFPLLAPHVYNTILWKVCNLLSSLLLSAILLISSLYTLCASFLNFCCDFRQVHCLISNFYNN